MAENEDQAIDVVSTADVLGAEYRLIWQEEPPGGASPKEREAAYRLAVLGKNQAALCLSGGGIRSAAFALGVLQALSAKNMLTHFHYLSTVSGGGYIGSWLQRWICEEKGGAEAVMVKLGGVTEPAQVSALRENSNFITPRVGVGSNDTWTALSISGRNIALNWLLFAPLLMLVTVAPNLFEASVLSLPRRATEVPVLAQIALALSAVAAIVAAFNAVRGLPSYRATCKVLPGSADGWLIKWIVVPLVLWSISGTLCLAIDLLHQPLWFGIPGAALAAVSLAASVAGLVASGFTLPPEPPPPAVAGQEPVPAQPTKRHNRYRHTFATDIPLWLVALVMAALLTLFGAGLFQAYLSEGIAAIVKAHPQLSPEGALERWTHNRRALSPLAVLTVVGPLWLMATQLLIAVVFAGFRPVRGKTVRPDADREWLARLSAVKIKPMLLWGMVGFAVLILDWALLRYVPGYDTSISGMIAVASGFAAVAGGKSSKSGNSTSTVQGIGGFVLKYIPMQGLIALGTGIFVLMLFLILGRIEQNGAESIAAWLATWERPSWLDHEDVAWIDPDVVAHLAMLVILGALVYFLSGRIQVNRFSLNGLYRNRLTRAFLGGARQKRDPDPFTGFDAADNVRMHTLTPRVDGRTILYPVVNVALNVTASEKLAWQERKAEPFVFTPCYSGSAMLKPPDWPSKDDPEADLSEPPGAYVDSKVYGGNEPDLAMPDCGVSLATAMSISGAAASPNMGYHTSAATALLMTLFNVRLGAWLPNPAQAEDMGDLIRRSGPSNSLRALLRELAGATDDRGWDIYLSDGGHFENLGLYEMVRRRCRYIIVSDAGADPECAFGDLGGAVRKVKIDLDVDISFDDLDIYARDPANKAKERQRAFALGTIEYPERRYAGKVPETPEARKLRTGHLLYIKPSYFGQLPVDVRSYAEISKTFPHESTADQFFSESQFESYRRLGYYFTSALGGTAPASVEAFFDAVEAQLAPKHDAPGGEPKGGTGGGAVIPGLARDP